MGAIPSGDDPSGFDAGALEGTLVGAGISALALRTEANVRASKNVAVKAEMKGLSDQVFEGIDPSLGIVHGALKAFADRLNPAGDHSSGSTSELLDKVGKVPILGSLVEIFTGLEDGDYDDLGTWVNALLAALQAAAEGFAGILQDIPLLGDLIEILSGTEDGNPDDLGSWGLKVVGGIQQMINSVVVALFGWVGDLFSEDDAAQALQDAHNTIAGLTAQVTALVANRNNQAIGGVGKIFSFPEMESSSTFGTGFTHTRFGGTGHYEIVKGVGARWLAGLNSDATDSFRFLDLPTVSDFQKIWIAYGTSPQQFNNATAARCEIHGRKNYDGTVYVFASLEKYKAEIGCVVPGVTPGTFTRLVFATRTNFSFKASSVYALVCGTVGVGNLRVFQLLEDDRVILTAEDDDEDSMIGEDYRYPGGLGFAKASSLGSNNPGTMWAFAYGDNYPPALVGSGFRRFRADIASPVTPSSNGDYAFDADFFDTGQYITGDMSQNSATNSCTVSLDGWYTVTVRVALSAWSSSVMRFAALLYLNSGTSPHRVGRYNVTGESGPAFMEIFTDVYLEAGDSVRPGYRLSNTVDLTEFVGEASGAETYWSVVLTNRSLA